MGRISFRTETKLAEWTQDLGQTGYQLRKFALSKQSTTRLKLEGRTTTRVKYCAVFAPHQKPTTSNDVHTAARVLSKTKAASLRHFSTYVESDIMERHAISVATPAGARLECAANASAL